MKKNLIKTALTATASLVLTAGAMTASAACVQNASITAANLSKTGASGPYSESWPRNFGQTDK